MEVSVLSVSADIKAEKQNEEHTFNIISGNPRKKAHCVVVDANISPRFQYRELLWAIFFVFGFPTSSQSSCFRSKVEPLSRTAGKSLLSTGSNLFLLLENLARTSCFVFFTVGLGVSLFAGVYTGES